MLTKEARCLCSKTTTWMRVIGIILMTQLAVISAAPATPSSTDQGHETAKRRHHHVPEKEIAAIAETKIEEMEDLRAECKFGEFLNRDSMTCASCEEYCPNEMEMVFCGQECKNYYQVRNLQQQIDGLQKLVSGQIFIPGWAWAAGCFALVLITLIMVACCSRNWILKKLHNRKAFYFDSNDTTPTSTLPRGTQETENNRQDHASVGNHLETDTPQ